MSSGLCNVSVRALKLVRQAHLQIVGHPANAGHPEGRALGALLLGVARHGASEGRHAVGDGHADVVGVDA
jgi:hypothetical protein